MHRIVVWFFVALLIQWRFDLLQRLTGKYLVVKPALPEDCLDTGASYAERKQQREEELKDLETALKMLSNV